jgi:hypothetical protein
VVLINDVVADPHHGVQLNAGEEVLDPVQTGNSGAAAVWMTRCGGFLLLLCLRDWISSNVEVGIRS